MLELLRKLVESISSNTPVAYCRLVETRGSTPQKAGAAMLVYADGSQFGTLGGGCVEADVKRRAISALAMNQALCCSFQLDSDYGWGDGLICGGRMRVVVQPANNAAAAAYFRQLCNVANRKQGHTEAIHFSTGEGSVPPAFALFDNRNQLVATLHFDSEVVAQLGSHLQSLSERPRPYAHGDIAFLPTLPICRLVIVGGGHVGQAVAKLASELEFEVWVSDDRAEFLSAERFPTAERRLAGELESTLSQIPIDAHTYCLIVTRGHQHDEEALYHLIDRHAAYVGMIGSRRKIRLIFDDLLEKGISQSLLDRVHAPVGIDIGSLTVPEIAVSICAELVSHRNRSGIVPGRPDKVTV